ncbi:unnamed protein product [Pleuronectes platessa]|uniref:Uncharacterized protein n=1 Tax=Pleuronectes platessa TaxID=8262 RepID=A0A9N7YEL5_PLEPL|nr:unnamed protein product [Pleuronectes platessa]
MPGNYRCFVLEAPYHIYIDKFFEVEESLIPHSASQPPPTTTIKTSAPPHQSDQNPPARPLTGQTPTVPACPGVLPAPIGPLCQYSDAL